MNKAIPKKKAMMKMNTSNEKVLLEEALDLSFELAIKAAKFLIKKQKKLETLKITTKVAQGIASEADTESEKLIINGIKKKYPDHFGFLNTHRYQF